MGTQTATKNERLTCPPDHKHGVNSTCYTAHNCRCDACRERGSTDRNQYRKRAAYGRPTTDLVDTAPVRDHINQLRAAGMGQGRIADLAKVPPHVIRHVLYGTGGRPVGTRMRTRYAAAILAVQPDPNQMLRRDPRGTQRRLQALAVQGWSLTRLARLMGVTPVVVHRTMNHKWVTTETHERVVALFEQLWNVEPPTTTPSERHSVSSAKSSAHRFGWVPAMAWDDIDNDPQPPKPGRPPGSVREREEAVRRLHGLRWSDTQIAAELGVATDTVWRIRGRLGLPGWTREQQEAAA